MADGLSLREFGREFGVTGEAVRKAIAEGKIPADCVGRRAVGKGKTTWPVITDPVRAAEHWRGNREHNQVRDTETMATGAKRGWEKRRSAEPADDGEDLDAVPPAGASTDKRTRPSITDSNQIAAAYKAQIARLDYEERRGILVKAEVIETKFVGLMAALRNRIMGIPSEAKARIPHLTVDELEILEDLIAGALDDVADEDAEDDNDE